MVILLFCLATYPQLDVARTLATLQEEGLESTLEVLKKAETTPYDFGMAMMREGRTEEALDWFERLTLETGKAKYWYGRAWIQYVQGEHEEAAVAVAAILKEEPSQLVKARCYYLKGYLHLEKPDFEKAKKAFLEAVTLYRSEKKRGGLINTYAGLASVSTYQRNFTEARAFVEAAEELNLEASNQRNMGWVHEIKSEIYFHERNYDQAVDSSRKSRNFYEQSGDKAAVLQVDVKLGLLEALAGNLEASYDLAMKADGGTREQRSVKLGQYNLLTWIYLYRCSGQDYKTFQNEIERWLESYKDSELEELLKFVLSVDCPDKDG